MKTFQIKCQERDASVKVKKLRRQGMVPGVIYGKHFNVQNVQFNKKELYKFISSNTVGSRVSLNVDDANQLVMLKDVQKNPLTDEIDNVDFQALTVGEKVRVSVVINFVGRENLDIDSIVQELVQDIEIEALPKDLIDHIDVDLSEYKIGDSITIEQLAIMKNDKIEVITSADTTIAIITAANKFEEETVEEETLLI